MASHWRWTAAGVVLIGSVAAAQAQSPDSSACFSAALYKKGAFLDYDVRVTIGGRAEVWRQTEEVLGRKKFNGYAAAEIKNKIIGDNFKADFKYYLNLTDTTLFSYGSYGKSNTTTIDPPEQFSATLAEGESFKQTVVYKTAFPDGDKIVSERKNTSTFKGVENLVTQMGTIAACKYEVKVKERFKGSSNYDSYTQTYWFGAEAPYRGFILKGVYGRQTNEVIRIRKFDLE